MIFFMIFYNRFTHFLRHRQGTEQIYVMFLEENLRYIFSYKQVPFVMPEKN